MNKSDQIGESMTLLLEFLTEQLGITTSKQNKTGSLQFEITPDKLSNKKILDQLVIITDHIENCTIKNLSNDATVRDTRETCVALGTISIIEEYLNQQEQQQKHVEKKLLALKERLKVKFINLVSTNPGQDIAIKIMKFDGPKEQWLDQLNSIAQGKNFLSNPDHSPTH